MGVPPPPGSNHDYTKLEFIWFGVHAKLDIYFKLNWFLVNIFFSHTVTVTKELLLQLYSHTMDLKIWDTKDKVSPRARFDRPKAFRIPASRGPEDAEGGSGGVMQIVNSQQQSFESNQPKQSRIVHTGDILFI